MRCPFRMGVVFVAFLLMGITGFAQTLNLPTRPANALGGAAFERMIEPLSFSSTNRQLSPREIAICGQVLQGNIPGWMRQMTQVTTNAIINGTNHTVSYYVAPDYLAVGSDQDYFLIPTTPLLAQRLADALNCSLPTAKMVNDIWTKAPCKLAPSTIPPSAQMTTVPVYDDHNTTVRGQRFAVTNSYPLGTLTSGDKKDVIIANKIYTNFAQPSITNPVVIYGWIQLNGSPIQPVYNGHEETYADYSHGIRLVQMNITVDGQANTVTNILKNPSLAALLSDDTTLADNVITTPRYFTTPMPPCIAVQPVSQTVISNSLITLSALAIGDTPITYQWQCNGTTLVGATDISLTLSNVQSINIGAYSVIASNEVGTTASIPALVKVQNPIHPILFQDNFGTNSSASWELFWAAGDGVADYSVDWTYDYSQQTYTFNGTPFAIPPSPNSSGTSRGIKLTVNNSDTNGVIAAVNLYPKTGAFSNDYALKFDMWINYPGDAGGANSSGSTEFAIFGLDHLGTQPNWGATNASSSDGVWFGVDGEGGTSRDYRAYVGNPNGTEIELIGISSGLTESNNASGIYPALFPTTRHETVGAPGKSWVEVEVRQVGGVLSWFMDGTLIAQRTNTSSFTSGKVMLGFMDVFSSIASPTNAGFVLFDNVRVEDLTQTLQPPSILGGPTNLQVLVGSNASFQVTAIGSAPLLYQWSFNSVPITGATNQTLQLNNVQLTNGGAYQIVVSNAAGFVAATATLTVLSQPAQFGLITRSDSGVAQLIFTGASGTSYIVETSSNLLSWLPISVFAISNGPLSFFDPDAINHSSRFYRTYGSSSQTLTDFDSFTNGASVLFQRPITSGSTSNFLDTAFSDFAYVTNTFPIGHTSSNVLAVSWSFKTGATNPWLRLTTFNAANLPNPVVGFHQALQFDVYSDRDIYITLGLRETNAFGPVGSDGGTTGTIEWVGGNTSNTSPPRGRLVSAGQWATLAFFIPDEPALGFTGNGLLTSTTGQGVLEHLCLVPAAGSGPYHLFLDRFSVIDLLR